jgi:hypothetical protein
LDGLKDIKEIVSIPDYSAYLFTMIVISMLVIFYFIIKKVLRYKRVILPIEIAKKELKNLDLSDSKTTAYKITKYGRILKDEDFSYLEKYKYKKVVIKFLKEDLKKIEGFLNAI